MNLLLANIHGHILLLLPAPNLHLQRLCSTQPSADVNANATRSHTHASTRTHARTPAPRAQSNTTRIQDARRRHGAKGARDLFPS